ncbi:MAG: hypothetical protein ABUK08_00080 [Candidatus Humimicrobiaceae bacterium]
MWGYVVVLIISLLVAYATAPKAPEPKPPVLADIEVPTAEQGRPIPVIFGTRILKSPNVIWYGDLRYKAVKAGGGK